MNVYICDFGWSGCVFVIASNMNDALTIMEQKNSWSDHYKHKIKEYPLTEGFYFMSQGE